MNRLFRCDDKIYIQMIHYHSDNDITDTNCNCNCNCNNNITGVSDGTGVSTGVSDDNCNQQSHVSHQEVYYTPFDITLINDVNELPISPVGMSSSAFKKKLLPYVR